MPGKFCYVCGADEFKESLCEQHFYEVKATIKLPGKITVEKCSKCNLARLKNKRVKFDANKFFTERTKQPVNVKLLGKRGKNDVYEISIGKEKKEVLIHFDVRVCQECGKFLGGYYEGTLQLRGDFPKEILDIIDEAVRKRDSFYRIKEIKVGLNVEFGSKSLLKTLVNGFSKKYKIKPTESFELVTQKDGKDVTRRIMCLRWKS
jgi:NMD protein affecting ribosome stability and mRNA decay